MKRILTIIAAVTMLVAGLAAQTKTLVTLSHEGELSFFDGVSQLDDAISASADGDVIYLSDGKFGTAGTSLKITNKKISIVGNGYNSHILSNVYFAHNKGVNIELDAPLFDGLRLEKITFSNGFNEVEVKKCYIKEFSAENAYNILLDRCYLEKYENLYSTDKTIKIINCKIDTSYPSIREVFENCNIALMDHWNGSYVVNSIIKEVNGGGNQTTNGIYENCLIGSKVSDVTEEYRNCYELTEAADILDDNLECTIDDMSEYVGTDGTVIGVYGGEWFPYSETPSVPTVDSANSSVVYDKENNQLNVTITVAPN